MRNKINPEGWLSGLDLGLEGLRFLNVSSSKLINLLSAINS